MFLLLIFLIYPLSLSASELNLEYEISDGNSIRVAKKYVEEPVSEPHRLTIVQICPKGQKELFNKKKCNFNNFKFKKDTLTFDSFSYDTKTGRCKETKTKTYHLAIKPKC